MNGRHGEGRGPRFHELEMAFRGCPGCGRSTLIRSLAAALTARGLRPGWAVEPSRGPDGDGATQGGMREVEPGLMPCGGEWRAWGRGAVPPVLRMQRFAACDLVLVEDDLDADAMDTLLFVDGLRRAGSGRPAAFVSADAALAGRPLPEATRRLVAPDAADGLPVFHRDDVRGVLDWLVARWEAVLATRPLLGLVLAGGRSERMGSDKALLELGGVSLVERAARLLDVRCREVWISARSGQGREGLGRPVLTDRFVGFGPAGGILSALHERPEAAWLVLGCDLPLVTPQVLEALLKLRNPWRAATAFRDPGSGLPEPLCAVWEPRSRVDLLGSLAMGQPCPRRVLGWNRACLGELPERDALLNANRPEDWAVVRSRWEDGRVPWGTVE